MSNTHTNETQEMNSKSLRGLSNTSVASNGESRTLLFTSSTSNTMSLLDESPVAYTGLYRCALHEVFDSESGDDLQRCVDAQKVADGFNRDGSPHAALSLHNLQFHNRSHETKKSHRINDEFPNGSRLSYLYANTPIDNREEHPGEQMGSWEIIRAKLPGSSEEVNSANGHLQFESVFRTLDAFDWNECDFKCCPYNSNKDDDPFQYSKEEENNYYAHTHAYVRAIPRSFSVDETNGDIFVSWEGFYQACDPASIVQEKSLKWTIGVSRLRTEDPYCTTDQVHVMENNFARCTEPVSIVHQNARRDIVLPYGGFTVVPARDGDSRRSFIMSAVTSSEIQGDHKSFMLAVPEGGGRNIERMTLTESPMDRHFNDVWDGGTIRLHKNTQTGRPDHICRSIFNKGIGCMPIADDPDADRIISQGEEKIVLAEEEVASFCAIQDGDRAFPDRRKYHTPVVTGLEVVWDEHDGIASPKQIIFGCFGGGNSNGNFGMVDLNGNGESTSPIQLVKGAFPGAMLFPPQDLEQSLTQSLESSSTSNVPSAIFQQYTNSFGAQSCGVVIASLLLCILCLLFHSKRRRSQSRCFPETVHNLFEEKQDSKHYMELPTVDTSRDEEENDNTRSCCHRHVD